MNESKSHAERVSTFETATTTIGHKLSLQTLEIEGLLSFGEKTSFEFGRLNILVGPNGSGKSNLIDCVRLLRYSPLDIQQVFADSGFEDWLYRGLDRQQGNAVLQVTLGLPAVTNSLRHAIRLTLARNSRAQLEELVSDADGEMPLAYFSASSQTEPTLNINDGENGRRDRRLDTYNSSQSILSQIRDAAQYPEISYLAALYSGFKIYSEWSFGRNSNLRESASAGRSDTSLSESMSDLPIALNALERTAAHDKIRLLLHDLKETYGDYVTRVSFGRVGLELLEAPFDQPLPARRLSDGTLRFLALAAILLQNNPPALICIEEPELGMHPDMIRMVAGMIVDASSRTQLIITTHSEHLLSALQDDFDALFTFDAGLDGSVTRRYGREEYKMWRQEHTLGELWTSGELGGNRW